MLPVPETDGCTQQHPMMMAPTTPPRMNTSLAHHHHRQILMTNTSLTASHQAAATADPALMPTSPRRQNTHQWWERSVIKRSALAIDELVESMVDDSPFLQKAEDAQHKCPTVALLEREQIQVNNHYDSLSGGCPGLLGKGSFSVVYEVTDVFASEEQEQADSSSSTQTQRVQHLSCMARQGQLAMKHLRPDLIHKKDAAYFQGAAADLIQEAKFLAALQHPHVLRVHAIARGDAFAYHTSGGSSDGFFLITDRLHGTLRDKITEWQCLQESESVVECFSNTPTTRSTTAQDETKEDSTMMQRQQQEQQQQRFHHHNNSSLDESLWQEKLELARQLASALEYLHAQRLIWRDCKPPNVGILDGTVKLFDLGFCRELPASTGSYPAAPSYSSSITSSNGGADQENADDDAMFYMSGKGSLMYLAPEVLQSGRYNQKADCYSFAMVLYELLTLNKPFHSVPNQDVFRELICQYKARPPLEYAPEISPALQELLRHAWDDNVYERWTMRRICRRLEEIIESGEWRTTPCMQQQQAAAEARQEEPQDVLVDHDADEDDINEPTTNYMTLPFSQYKPSSSSSSAGGLAHGTGICGGGSVLDTIFGMARNVRRGYKILTSVTKEEPDLSSPPASPAPQEGSNEGSPSSPPTTPRKVFIGFRSEPIQFPLEDDDEDLKCAHDSLLLLDLSGAPTAETEESYTSTSSGSGSNSSYDFGAFRLQQDCAFAMAAEEPLEVTLEQTLLGGKYMSMAAASLLDDSRHDLNDAFHVIEDDDDEEEDIRLRRQDDDYRTESDHEDYLQHLALTHGGDDKDDDCCRDLEMDLEMRCPPSPLARTTSAPLPEQSKVARSDAMMGDVSPARQHSPRRQSISFGKEPLVIPESHWLPTAADMRG